MDLVIETRELITVTVQGVRLLGTYHKPRRERTLDGNANGVGVLFVNSGFMPRSAAGDTAVYWADALAQSGYPCLRLDLTGLGDTPGDLTANVRDFVALVNAGYYGSILAGAVEEFAKLFRLQGVVVAGHCAGGVSAIYAAATCQVVKGLILLDPYFHLGEEPVSATRHRIRSLALRNPLVGLISDFYGRVKQLWQFPKRWWLPGNANLSLIRCWTQLAHARIPIIVLTAPMAARNAHEFDYIYHLERVSGVAPRVVVRQIEGTDHAFVKGDGKRLVRSQMEQWLSAHFPLECGEASRGSTEPLPVNIQVACCPE